MCTPIQIIKIAKLLHKPGSTFTILHRVRSSISLSTIVLLKKLVWLPSHRKGSAFIRYTSGADHLILRRFKISSDSKCKKFIETILLVWTQDCTIAHSGRSKLICYMCDSSLSSPSNIWQSQTNWSPQW